MTIWEVIIVGILCLISIILICLFWIYLNKGKSIWAVIDIYDPLNDILGRGILMQGDDEALALVVVDECNITVDIARLAIIKYREGDRKWFKQFSIWKL